MSTKIFTKKDNTSHHEFFAGLANTYGTPLYLYNLSVLTDNIELLKNSIGGCPLAIHYAVKANANHSILNIMARNKLGADIVSGGELRKCLKAGIAPQKIIFSGVGKTTEELSFAISSGVGRINIESLSELKDIQKHYEKSTRTEKETFPQISLRINPKINSKTHPYIATALGSSKFGFDDFELAQCIQWYDSHKNSVPISGLSAHIGSQLTDLKLYQKSLIKLHSLANTLPFPINHLDLGGGLGIGQGKSIPSLRQYGLFLKKLIAPFKKQYSFSIEPGRSLVGTTGVLLASVIRKKQRRNKIIYILDAGMNDLIRPALYGAIHPIEVINQIACNSNLVKAKKILSDFAGPVCESSDYFLKNVVCSALEEGTLIAIQNAGAYGYAMASEYNSREKPLELLYWQDSSNRKYKAKNISESR